MNIKQYFIGYSEKRPALDVRMLILINLLASTLVLMSRGLTLLFVAFCISLLALIIFHMYKQAFYYALLFFCSLILVLGVSKTQSHGIVFFIVNFLTLFVFMLGKILPFVMIAHIIFTKMSINYLVASLRKLGLHRGLLLSLVVALRYLPTAKSEFKTIKSAMQLRGIELSLKNFFKQPLAVIEFSLVPLLFKNVAVAEEMSAAATVKGIEFEGKQTSLIKIQWRLLDYIFAITSVVLVIISYLEFWQLESMAKTFLSN